MHHLSKKLEVILLFDFHTSPNKSSTVTARYINPHVAYA
jgi:hypothetical protein